MKINLHLRLQFNFKAFEIPFELNMHVQDMFRNLFLQNIKTIY